MKKIIVMSRFLLSILTVVGMLLTTFPALSQSSVTKLVTSLIREEDIPVYDAPLAEETCDMLYLIVNKSRVLHLDSDVKSVRINDPERLIVFIKDPRTLYVLAKEKKGIAHFTALDKNGKTVMARYVIIKESKSRYVRARILCPEKKKDAACGKIRLYYCTNQCYETYIMRVDKKDISY